MRLRKPSWLKVKAPGGQVYLQTRTLVQNLSLHTVCQEAKCPNIGECWQHKTATFLILGNQCSRSCHFCAVKTADRQKLPAPDPLEPTRIAQAVQQLELEHVVITSVTRDDLADGGAEHFAATVKEIHCLAPHCNIELLIPDLLGSVESLSLILASGINVLNHNLETVERLYPSVRPQANYQRSLRLLKTAKEIDCQLLTKSGLMLGLGEQESEVHQLMQDLRAHAVDIVTLGQYLQPSPQQLPVAEYISPEQFEAYRQTGVLLGFAHIEANPLVRSSYRAWRCLADLKSHKQTASQRRSNALDSGCIVD